MPPPSGSRQSHTKSRNGCGQCKRRRVRCNLEPPVCSNCRRRGEHCDYLTAIGLPPPRGGDPEDGQTSRTVSLPQTRANHHDRGHGSEYFVINPFLRVPAPSMGLCAPHPDIVSWILDEVLLVPFVSPEEKLIWAGTITKEADKFSYLEPSATSILHLYESFQGHSAPAERRANAFRCNIKAVNLFRSSDQIITEDNWMAVLGFGVSLVIFKFAAARLTPSSEHNHVEIFNLLRSTAHVIAMVIPHFEQSQLRVYVDYRISRFKVTLDEELWRQLQRLDAIQFPDGTTEETIQACHHAVDVLKAWVREIGGHPYEWKHFWRWPGVVTKRFAQLVSARYPAALLIFIYWCAVMNGTPRRWYLDGWARRDGLLAMASLDATWDEFLDWPRQSFDPLKERPLVKIER